MLRLCLLLGSMLVASLGLATGAEARKLTAHCGQVLTKPGLYVLQNDVGPCNSDGLVVGANNVKLNLNGHTVSGIPAQMDSSGAITGGVGEGVGVRVVGKRHGQVRNGTVRDFDAGVLLARSGEPERLASRHLLTGLTLRSNVGNQGRSGPQTEFSDGIALLGAPHNVIENNTATGNGGAGITLNDGSNGNRVRNNRVIDNLSLGIRAPSLVSGNAIYGNTVARNGSTGINMSFDITNNDVHHNVVDANGANGIRTSVNSSHNKVRHNTVTNNTAAGIAFDFGDGNQASMNSVTGNGADGIRVGGGDEESPTTGSLVSDNQVRGNARNGVVITCTLDAATFSHCVVFDQHNKVLDNDTSGNGTGTPLISGPRGLIGSYDLLDGNTKDNPQYPSNGPECDNNTWSANSFGTAEPECTRG